MRKFVEQIRAETVQVTKEIDDMERQLYQKQHEADNSNSNMNDTSSSHHSDQ